MGCGCDVRGQVQTTPALLTDLLEAIWQGYRYSKSKFNTAAASEAAIAYRECLTYMLLHMPKYVPADTTQPSESGDRQLESALDVVLSKGLQELALAELFDAQVRPENGDS